MTINKEKTNNVNITEITKAGKAHTHRKKNQNTGYYSYYHYNRSRPTCKWYSSFLQNCKGIYQKLSGADVTGRPFHN